MPDPAQSLNCRYASAPQDPRVEPSQSLSGDIEQAQQIEEGNAQLRRVRPISDRTAQLLFACWNTMSAAIGDAAPHMVFPAFVTSGVCFAAGFIIGDAGYTFVGMKGRSAQCEFAAWQRPLVGMAVSASVTSFGLGTVAHAVASGRARLPGKMLQGLAGLALMRVGVDAFAYCAQLPWETVTRTCPNSFPPE